MRPDYTLSLWPAGFSQDQAEEQELITHVHFDAKYKVDSLIKLFGKEDESSDEEESYEKDPVRAGNYKRADLLKMHAYRDAIRRSAGAYVLYPGNEKEQPPFKGFHELLPGLGAFPLRPNATNEGSQALKCFIKEVVAHVCNRATHYEQQTYHTYRIHKQSDQLPIKDALPETDGSYRARPATDEFVIHGWISGPRHLEWVERSGLYNFRTENRRGSLRLHESVAGASYILLHGKGDYQGGGSFFRIVSDGPRVFSSESLIESGYPGTGSQPYYLVYDVRPLEGGSPLNDYDWDLGEIDGIGTKRASAVPLKGIPLNEFMKGARAVSGPTPDH